MSNAVGKLDESSPHPGTKAPARLFRAVGYGLAALVLAMTLSGFATATDTIPPAVDEPMPAQADGLFDLSSALDDAGLLTEYPDVFAGLQFDRSSGNLLVKYFAGAPEARVDSFLNGLAALNAAGASSVVADPVGFDYATMENLAQEIAQDSAAWAEVLGLSRITGASVDITTGEIIIYATDDVDKTVTVGANTFRIEGSSSAIEFQPGTRDSRSH